MVHWLRLQAQRNQWREEFLLVTYEMQWTVRYFIHHSQQWQSASESNNTLPGPLADCQSCMDLHNLIHDMFDETHMMHGFLGACESEVDAKMNADVRKVAGFHGLHELALLKEIQSKLRKLTPAPAPATAMAVALATSSSLKNIHGAGRWVRPSATEQVSAHAQAELECLKALPPTSYKWTWGIDITKNEVLAINQKKGRGKAQHSGYIASLPDGPPQNKEWSETPSLPTVPSYGRPLMVTGCNAGLYFSDSDSDVSNAGTPPFLPVPAAAALTAALTAALVKNYCFTSPYHAPSATFHVTTLPARRWEFE